MKAYIMAHKKALAIAGVAILLFAAISALLITQYILRDKSRGNHISDVGVFGDDIIIHTADEGEIVIEPTKIAVDSEPGPIAPNRTVLAADLDNIWTEDAYTGRHTPVEKAKMQDGSLGVLSIDRLNLSVNVFESPDNLDAMTKGVAHFPSTSAWDGNVGFSAHNVNLDGSDGFFKNLHTLKEGDIISYKTGLGERTYTVSSIATIAASDWSPLNYIDANQLTMITCISGQPDKRLCVTAIEQHTEGS